MSSLRQTDEKYQDASVSIASQYYDILFEEEFGVWNCEYISNLYCSY